MNLAAQYLAGLKILSQWDGIVVPGELAQKRCDTCKVCPLNKKGNVLVEAVAKAIKRKMEEKLCRQLHVEGIEEIHTCSACNCFMPAKIWFPLQSIYPKEGEKKNFDPKCWLLNET